MTHHTDAEQLHQLLELVLTELDRKAIPIAYMQEIDRKGKAFIEQAARRAPVAPVPQYEPVAYLWQHCETGRTRVVMPDMVITADANWIVVGPLYLAAAPQPPEAAPVKLPEPVAWMLGCQTLGGDAGWKLSWSQSGAGVCNRLAGKEFEHALYTEQQVRELLEQAAQARDAAFEAVRKAFCKLQRYSFALDSRGNVRRCADHCGNWVEFEAVHTLFEPQSVDAALAAQAKQGCE